MNAMHLENLRTKWVHFITQNTTETEQLKELRVLMSDLKDTMDSKRPIALAIKQSLDIIEKALLDNVGK